MLEGSSVGAGQQQVLVETLRCAVLCNGAQLVQDDTGFKIIGDPTEASLLVAAAFIVLSCAQLFHSFNCRSMTESIFKIGIFSNTKLIVADLVSFLLQVGAVYLPFAQKIFKTESLSAFDWFLVLAISSLPLWAMEIYKMISRRLAPGAYRNCAGVPLWGRRVF